MRKKSLSGRLKDLSIEKKIIAVASLVTLISCFLPWYGINSRVINEWWDAFGSIGSVAGYVISVFSLLSLVITLAPVIKPELDVQKKLPFKETALLVFFSAQSLFVSLIFIPVYAQYSLINASNSGARFGIYLALLSSLVASVVAVFNHRKAGRVSLQQDDFVSMPRAHRAVDDWQEGEATSESEEMSEADQETMFESHPVHPVGTADHGQRFEESSGETEQDTYQELK